MIPAHLAAEYEAFLLKRQERITIPALVVGTTIMVGMLIIDLAVIPDVLWLSIGFRLLITIPLAVVSFFYLYKRQRSLREHHVSASLVALLFGVMACLIVVGSDEPLAPMYLTANNITVMFSILILGLQPRMAIAIAALLIVTQALILSLFGDATAQLLFLMTGISLGIAIPAVYGNMRMRDDQRRQFLHQERNRQQLRKLSAKNALLEKLAVLDPLTALSNRRGFDAMLQAAIEDARADATVGAIALAMIDVDHFKLFNDTRGHLAGDLALREVAQALSEATGEAETVARYGGEEFSVIMPSAEPRAMTFSGARLRNCIDRLQIPHPASPTARTLSVSIGIAYAGREALDALSPHALIEAADAALYRAKTEGRNRVVIAEWNGPPAPIPDYGQAANQ